MKSMTATGALLALAMMPALPAIAQDWKEDYQVVRFGILSGENEQDRIQRYTALENYLEAELGVEVEIFSASSYDGVIQALAADQIEFSFLGSSSYAAAYTATDGGVIPLLVSQNEDGTTGYYSIIVTRCDSGITSLDDLEGKTLAFADPDSTSGYAVPYYNLVQQGYEPGSYFSATPFSGSHEAGVQGVANGTFDAAATNQDTKTSGVPQRMVEKGMLEDGVICTIWESPEITGSPFTARANLPQGLIDDMREAMLAFPHKDPEGYDQVNGTVEGDDNPLIGYTPVDHERYQWIVDMRQWLKDERRG